MIDFLFVCLFCCRDEKDLKQTRLPSTCTLVTSCAHFLLEGSNRHQLSCSSPLFPSVSFKGSLCRFFALCLPVCLQRPVTQILALALFLSNPLYLSRDPYVGSPLSVPPSVFRDLLLRSLFLLPSSLPLSLFQEISM